MGLLRNKPLSQLPELLKKQTSPLIFSPLTGRGREKLGGN